MKKTDVIIIGAGPVGLFAVHQLGIKGLKAVVIDNQNEKVMIVGHDPTLTNFLNHFLPNQQLDKIPTSSVVELQILAENWIDLKKSTTKTISQILPKTMQTIKLK